MKAVVMAGGEGSRLRPLTSNRPKPLVPVCNKPTMEYIVELLRSHGVEQIVVTLHYLANEVVSYFGDGSDWGVRMIYSVEDEPLGTAGSVKKVEQYLNDTFIIISGDALTDFDLTRAVEFHRERKSVATIALTRVENPLEYGVVITDEDGRIRRFVEKPSWGEVFSDTINTGIYILEPEIFDLMEPEKPYDFSKDLFPELLAKDRPMYGFITQEYWCDIGNQQMYRQSHIDMFNSRCRAEIPGEQVAKDVWIGEGTEIHPGATVQGPVVIGRHCRIKDGAFVGEMSSIGDNCIIEEGAYLTRSILWNNVFVGKKTRLTGATVCRQNTIKANANVGDGVILGDKCFIGDGAIIQPQVKVWPDKHIESGATVSMSLIWGIKWPGSLFGTHGISGLANIEITPDYALKLGSAFGAYLERGATVCTSRDSHPAARLLNRAIICGLTSVGVNVQDLRGMPTPISRFTIRALGFKGGVHSRLSPDDPRLLLIEFYDNRGINIEKSIERKIENNFFREDFPRTNVDEVGLIDFPPRVIDQYTEGFYSAIDTDIIRQANFKVVIDYAFGISSMVLPLVLGKLGCETVALNAYLDAVKGRAAMEDQERSLVQLGNIVTTLGADLGILMGVHAEQITLVDERGKVIDGNHLLAAMAHLALRNTRNGIIAVPVTAPSVIERIAHNHQGKVIRTKTDGRSLMHTAHLGEKKIIFAGDRSGSFIFPSFHPASDGMFAFAKLLELMARQKARLSEVVEKIPEFHVAQLDVDCPWQAKGKVMRRMIEDSRDNPVEMIEGIKVYLDRGWMLLNPDPSEPVVHLVAEGQSLAQAEEILRTYADKVGRFINEGGGDGPPDTTEALAKAQAPKGKKSRRGKAATVTSDMETVPEDRVFQFWAPGRYLGLRASSFREFVSTLHYIETESLEYHLERGDFANWVEYVLRNADLADKIRVIQERSVRGEQLREELLRVLR